MTVAYRSLSVRAPRGFTLVELLVVIAIIGVLMSLTLPAIQSARETARMTQCQNNLGQLAKATAQFEAQWKVLPSGGWGQRWIGQPPYQLEKQPGGWIYQVLPFAEEGNLATSVNPSLAAANQARARTAIPWLYCPTRRSASATPYSGETLLGSITAPTDAGRTDYAANVGNSSVTACDADSSKYPSAVPAPTSFNGWIDPNNTILNGAVVQRRGLRANDFSDGRGKTYLYGEKAMDRAQVDTGTWNGDKAPALSGFGNSIMRSTFKAPAPDANGLVMDCRFGSAHPGGLNFAFVDSAVRMQDFGIDPTVFSQLGNRKDKGPTNEGDYIK